MLHTHNFNRKTPAERMEPGIVFDVKNESESLCDATYKFGITWCSAEQSRFSIWISTPPEEILFLLKTKAVHPVCEAPLPILWASQLGYGEIVRFLLMDPSTNPSVQKNAPIVHAANFGHLEIVKMLLADPRVDSCRGGLNQALIEASRGGHAEVVRHLLADPRIDPSTKDNMALVLATCVGSDKVVNLFLADARVNPALHHTEESNLLTIAFRYGHVSTFRLLLSDPRMQLVGPGSWFKLFCLICVEGKVEMVRCFFSEPRLRKLINPASQNSKSFIQACKFGQTEVVRLLLLDGRVNPATKHNEAIREASKGGYIEIVKLLLAQSTFESKKLIMKDEDVTDSDPVSKEMSGPQVQEVDPSARRNQALCQAVKEHHYSVALLLLSHPKVYSSCPFQYLLQFRAQVSPLLLTKWSHVRSSKTLFLFESESLNYQTICHRYLPAALCKILYDYAFESTLM